MHALILCEAYGAKRGQQGYIRPNAVESRLNLRERKAPRIEPMPTLNRSAEIIAFPPRGRFAVVEQDESSARAPARVAKAASGSSWYHEEAIREERAKSNLDWTN
jgi:hypothetical protein